MSEREKTCFFRKMAENKGKTILICSIAFVLIAAIVTLSCLGAFVFNRFATGYVPTDADLARVNGDPANRYARVLIIGVDGMGNYISRMDEGSMPNYSYLFGGFTTDGGTRINASVTHEGVAVYPTLSAQNWCSMFHGVRPPYHGVTGGDANAHLQAGARPNEKYPSFIKTYLTAYPNEKVLSVCTWGAINNGDIEDLPQVKKINNTCETVYAVAKGTLAIGDADLVERVRAVTKTDGYADETYELTDAITVARIIDETAAENYKIAYMHLNQVDSAGHSYGFNKQNYIRAVSRVDVLIGKLFEAYKARGWLDDTLFILCTDHGHRYAKDGTGHGGNRPEEVNVTFAIAGKTVRQGTPGKYVNTDLAPIVSYALGVKANKNWQGKVPYRMFTLLG